MSQRQVAIIGGGAAGYFAAITAAEKNPDLGVFLLEATHRPLTKVKISGGGRCNATHACFDPKLLVQNYPRGGKELLGPFTRFQPRDMIEWFAKHGVELKKEADGRMFPVTDSSSTILQCLQSSAEKAGVKILLGSMVKEITPGESGFHVRLKEETKFFSQIVLATGSAPCGWEFAQSLGHQIVPPVPSLFTFEIDDERIEGLAGISFPDTQLDLEVGAKKFKQKGPLLITHWGLSGPGVLKLSAWAARELHEAHYQAILQINLLPHVNPESVYEQLLAQKNQTPKKNPHSEVLFNFPKRYWQKLVQKHFGENLQWGDLSHLKLKTFAQELTQGRFQVKGKGVFKEEFVTCGGVKLKEVDFQRMESKICRGVFFAGEILDIDGITGGFNFQNAWTTGWIVGSTISSD